MVIPYRYICTLDFVVVITVVVELRRVLSVSSVGLSGPMISTVGEYVGVSDVGSYVGLLVPSSDDGVMGANVTPGGVTTTAGGGVGITTMAGGRVVGVPSTGLRVEGPFVAIVIIGLTLGLCVGGTDGDLVPIMGASVVGELDGKCDGACDGA